VKFAYAKGLQYFAPMGTKNKLSKRQYALFVAVLIIYTFFDNSYDSILNYPDTLLFGSGVAIFISIMLYKIKTFINDIWRDGAIVKVFAIFLRCLTAVIFSWFLTGILLIPLNYYIIHTAKYSAAYTMDLKINGLGTRKRTRKIFYEFNGSGRTVYANAKTIDWISKNYNDYRLRVTIRKASLGTLVIENWEIVKKT